jgi:hypothetical protein
MLVPDDGATVPAGRTTVRGYAFAGHDRAVARVDISRTYEVTIAHPRPTRAATR